MQRREFIKMSMVQAPLLAGLRERLERMSDAELVRLSPVSVDRSREDAEGSLFAFVRQAWNIVEPTQTFVDGWHIRAICRHLEAVTDRKIPNLLMTIPPGTMKSLLTCVFWPSWGWMKEPWSRWLFASYSHDFSLRDSVRRRMIIDSTWYRSRWGSRVRLAREQNQKTHFENTARGWMLATSVGGMATGAHPDFVVIDDAHSAGQAESEKERQSAIDWFDGTISTRGVTRNVRRVVIGQRLHDEDLPGHLLRQGGWAHICLPMEFEPDRMPPTVLGWNDPRKNVGELLWPEMFTPERVARLSQELGPSRAAGQLQQKPPEHFEGAEWPKQYFSDHIWFDEWPDPRDVVLRVMTLDPSKGRTDRSDYSAFIMLALDREGTMWIDADIERRDTARMSADAVELGMAFRPEAFGIEANGYQELLCGPIEDASRKLGFMLPIVPMVNGSGGGKIKSRIRNLSPYLLRGEFRFKRDSQGTRLLVEMLKAWPGHRHDDGPDALELGVRLTRELWSGNIGGGEQPEEIVTA